MDGTAPDDTDLGTNPPALEVFLLGTPRVEYAGEVFEISRRQVRALLYRLAAEAQPVPRQQLCFLFWPDIPDSQARRNLTRLLSLLRNSLPVPDAVLTTGDSIGLDPEEVGSDVVRFSKLTEAAESESDPAYLQQAAELYRGDFLAGFSIRDSAEYEAWVSQERHTLERRYLEALADLVYAEMERGNHDRAISHAQRYLATDALAEDVHRTLIEIYTATGDRTAAIQQYERCAEILERELGVRPLPETHATFRAAREQVRLPRTAPTTEPRWTTLSTLDVPLIGRDEPMSQLEGAYERARRGEGTAVLVSGEAGVGKSRLVEAFAKRLGADAVILAGAGYRDVQLTPYLPVVEAIRSIKNLAAAVDHIEPVWLAEAARLLPELRGRELDLSTSSEVEPEQARTQLFEALKHIVTGLAGDDRPTVLYIDDLHWADNPTLSWLAYLGHHLQSSRLLLVGTHRTSPADTGDPETNGRRVGTLRHSLQRAGVLQHIDLSPLEEPAVADILSHLSLSDTGHLAQRLRDATGGNPFFLLEVLRGLMDTTGAVEDILRGEQLPVPGSIRQAVAARLLGLHPRARQLLEAGAVLGPSFGFSMVRAVAGRAEMETADSLDELVAHQLLLEDDADYRFQHDIIRMVVYDDLSPLRRQLLHRRAGEALERHRPSAVAALARHFERAGQEHVDTAIRYLVLTADHARGVYAHEEAIDHYERALALVREHQTSEQAARVLMKLGLAHHMAFDFERARRPYAEAFNLWRGSGAGRFQQRRPAPHPLRLSWGNPPTLDPTLAGDLVSAVIIDQLYSGLVELTADMDVVPDVAQRWDVSDGGRTYVFHLREDIAWTDGQPVTAGDFEYAWKRILDPTTDSPSARLLYDIRGARAFHEGDVADADQIGLHAATPSALVVELEEPSVHFPHLLTCCAARPVPAHIVEAHGATWTEPSKLVSNGPFKLVSWNPDDELVLTRNRAFHGRSTGNVEDITLTFVPDRPKEVALYEADELDVLGLWRIPLPMWDEIVPRYAEEYRSTPRLHTVYLGFNTRRPPFDDPRVRKAFVHATDRVAWVDGPMRGSLAPAYGGFIPPGMPAHSARIGLGYDLDEAQQLLAAAGYPGGRGLTTVELFAFQQLDIGCDHLSRAWQETLGANVRWQVLAVDAFLRAMEEGPPNVYLSGWLADYPDPDYFLRVSPHLERTGWHSEAYQRLVTQARTVHDEKRRTQMYRVADRLLTEEAAIMPLAYGRSHLLLKRWLSDYPVSPNRQWFWKDVIIEPH